MAKVGPAAKGERGLRTNAVELPSCHEGCSAATADCTQRTENREQRAENNEQRTESREQRTRSFNNSGCAGEPSIAEQGRRVCGSLHGSAAATRRRARRQAVCSVETRRAPGHPEYHEESTLPPHASCAGAQRHQHRQRHRQRDQQHNQMMSPSKLPSVAEADGCRRVQPGR